MTVLNINSKSEVYADDVLLGRMRGLVYLPDAGAPALADPTPLHAAVGSYLSARAAQISEADNASFVQDSANLVRWRGEEIAKLTPGESALEPGLLVLADALVPATLRERAEARLQAFIRHSISTQLKPLFDLRGITGLDTPTRGIAFQLVDALGVCERAGIATDVKQLDQTARGALRALGVRFGAHYVYLPALLKPKARALAVQLWLLKNEDVGAPALQALPALSLAGRTSLDADAGLSREAYRVMGYSLCGERAVRIDIIERLADMLRALVSYRPGITLGPPPRGLAGVGAFTISADMTSLLGCSSAAVASALKALGYVPETREAHAVEDYAKKAAEIYGASQPDVAAAPIGGSASTADSSAVTEAAPLQEKAAEPRADQPDALSQTPQTDALLSTAEGMNSPLPTADPRPPALEGVAAQDDASAAPAPATPVGVEVWKPARSARYFERKPPKTKRDPTAAQHEEREHARGKTSHFKPVRDPVRDKGKPWSKPANAAKNDNATRDGSRERAPFKGKERDRDSRQRAQQSERRLVFSTETRDANSADPLSPFAQLEALKAHLTKT